MALYQSRGRISEMSEVQSGTSKNGYEWQRMTITLDIPGFHGSVFKQVFQVSGDDVNDVLLYNIGDLVEISWSMYAREWNGKLYNNVDLVNISHLEQNNAPASKAEQEQPLHPAEVDDNPEQDLPF